MAHPEFVFRSKEEQTAKELYDKCGNSLPLLVIVNKGFYAIREELSFCTGQVLLLHRTQVQERALVYDSQGKTFSIPLDCCHYFTANDSTEEMTLRAIIIKHGVPVKMRFAESGVHTLENISLTQTLNVVAVHEEPFFLANTITQGALIKTVIAVPLYLKEVTFCQITDLVEKNCFASLQGFVTSLTKQVDQVDFSMDYSDKEMVKLSDKTVAPSANIYPQIETNVYINIKQTERRRPPRSTTEAAVGQRRLSEEPGQLYVDDQQGPHTQTTFPPPLARRPPPKVPLDEQKEQLDINIQQATPPSCPARRALPPVPLNDYTDASSISVPKAQQQPTPNSDDASVYEIPEPAKGQTSLTFPDDVKKPENRFSKLGLNRPKDGPSIAMSELDKALAKRRDCAVDRTTDAQIQAEAFKVKKASEIPLDAESGVVPLSVRPVPAGDAVARDSAANVGRSSAGPAEAREDQPDNKRTKAVGQGPAGPAHADNIPVIPGAPPPEKPPAVGTKTAQATLTLPQRPLGMTPIKTEVGMDPTDKRKPGKTGKSACDDGDDPPKILPKPKATPGPLSFEPLSTSSSPKATQASTSKTAAEKSETTYVNQKEMALIRPTMNTSDKPDPGTTRPKPKPTITSSLTPPEAAELSRGVAASEKANSRQQNPTPEEKQSEEKAWPRGLHQMSIAQVAEVLAKLNLDKYAAKFREEMVDGSVLSRLNDEALNKEFEMRLVEVARLRSFVETGKIPA